MDFIPYGRQQIDEEDIAAVTRVLRSDYLTSGPEIELFEHEFAEFVGAKHAVAVCNATAALHLAMLVGNIGPGDRVLTSPNSFVASANAAVYVGATPDFADIDSSTYNLTPETIKAVWKPDVRAIVTVAYAGQSPDMPGISKLAHQNNTIIIEDVCHGTGGGFIYDGKFHKLGGHPYADMSIFSFHPVKTMTTGEGGMLTTDNDTFAHDARVLRNQGLTRDCNAFTGQLPSYGPWSYEMQNLGFNYRMTDIQAALGRSQLRKLPSIIQHRQDIVGFYNNKFKDIEFLATPGLRNPEDSQYISWHLYSPRFNFEGIGVPRKEFMQLLANASVGSQVLYIPIYLQPFYQSKYNYMLGKCPIAEECYNEMLSLPLFYDMNKKQVDYIINNVIKIIT